MRKVFISSVVGGFEEYRQAARRAVELIGHTPVMCENFGARPYTSEITCTTEVEGCDIYLLIMGERYGYVTPSGISVTQAEYHAALQAGKPILVFVQKIKMETTQLAFRREVEDYQGGFFRAEFGTPEELKEEIIKGLRQLEQVFSAASEGSFQERKSRAIEQVQACMRRQGPQLIFTFWPQPIRKIDIVGIERELDSKFSIACKSGITKLRDGYEQILKKEFTGLISKDTGIFFFIDGIILILTRPTVEDKGSFFASSFAPPSKIRALSESVVSLIDFNGGWCGIDLLEMGHVSVEELPQTGTSSISMRMYGDSDASVSELMVPINPRRYLSWIDSAINLFMRIFSK